MDSHPCLPVLGRLRPEALSAQCRRWSCVVTQHLPEYPHPSSRQNREKNVLRFVRPAVLSVTCRNAVNKRCPTQTIDPTALSDPEAARETDHEKSHAST